MTPDLQKLISDIPKAELHIHIEGSLEPDLMFKLADRNEIKLKYEDVHEVREAYAFTNLQSFLDIYYESASVLQTEKDFYDLAYAYFQKSNDQNVRHAEIFFDPQTHTERGIPFDVMINGYHKACQDAYKHNRITSKLIMCFLRHMSEESAMKTLKEALPYKTWIAAVGLDSSEKGHPPSKFKNIFDLARKEGFLTVAHAGEEGPPEYIWEALNLLHVKRIDHGVRCLEDAKLVQELRQKQIPLTVCPLSNIKLRVYPDMTQHSLKKLLAAGLRVTINSDDPAYFGGYINDNYLAAANALDLTAEDIIYIAKNSFESSFLTDAEKKAYVAEIDNLTKTYILFGEKR